MKELSTKLIRTATSMVRHTIRQQRRIASTVLTIAASCLCLPPPAIAAPGSWTQKADMPLQTSTPASCVVEGILYVIGGHYPDAGAALRQVLAYDPGTDSWTRKKELPTARHFLAAAAVDGIIYVIGGQIGTGARVATVEAYDPKTDRWTTKKSLPTPLWFLTASVVDGLIYAFMGTETFAYDPKTDRWTAKARFSPWSMGLMSATVDRIIFLFGGMTEDMAGSYDFALAYDPTQDRFTARRRMPRTRLTAACGVIGGKVYLAGGVSKEPIMNPSAIFYQTLDVFDPQGGVTPQIISATLESLDWLRLVWQAEAGFKYGVEFSTEVVTNRWTRVTLPTGSTVLATNALVETSCLVARGEPRRFYRVIEAN